MGSMQLSIQIPHEVMDLLAERAKVLGTDPESLASVLLGENLRVWKRMTTANPLQHGRKARNRPSSKTKLGGSENKRAPIESDTITLS